MTSASSLGAIPFLPAGGSDAAPASASLSLPWRTGRHNDRIVYAQAGDHPADTDEMVATFFDPAVALEAVRRWNAGQAGL